MADHCAVHDLMFSQMAKDIKSMAESMTSALERIANQSTSNGDKLEQVLMAQGERKAVCARQDMRIEACEKESAFILEEVDKNSTLIEERTKELWSHNKTQDDRHTNLSKLVYIGIGVFIAAELALKILFVH